MKKILIIIPLLLLSCEREEEKKCECTTQRYERVLVRDMNTQAVISETEWQKSGDIKYVGDNCSANGFVEQGFYKAEPITGTYTYKHFEYLQTIICK